MMETAARFYSTRRLLYFLLIVGALMIPLFVTSRFYLHILIMCCIWGMAASSMNLIMGYTGQVNLAHGAFFGIGAYSAGLLMLKLGFNFWTALILACLITVVCGFFIGLLAFRTKGSYFAIGTMCFNVIVTVIIDSWEEVTEGARGLLGIPKPAPIPLPFGQEINFNSMAANYYLILFLLFLTLIIIHRVVRSMMGRSFMAIRGNEELAESLGINALKTKLGSLLISVFFAGLAGVFYASYIGFLSPEISDYHVTFELLIYCLIGGLGTMAGPLVGAFILTVISELLHGIAFPRFVAYGFLLVIIVIFFRGGFVGGVNMLWASLRGKGGR
jgi:branched-chain amino acid transport system permease protein